MPLRYVVPDTCAIAASLYNELHSSVTDPMLQSIRLRTVDAVAPTSGLSEFLNISRRKLDLNAVNPLSHSAVDSAVAEFMSLPITWVDIEPYAEEAWRLHRVHKIETGDAFFVTIAMEFSAEIWTVDNQFTATTKIMYENIYDLKVLPWRDRY